MGVNLLEIQVTKRMAIDSLAAGKDGPAIAMMTVSLLELTRPDQIKVHFDGSPDGSGKKFLNDAKLDLRVTKLLPLEHVPVLINVGCAFDPARKDCEGYNGPTPPS